jgi:hypothetical protein
MALAYAQTGLDAVKVTRFVGFLRRHDIAMILENRKFQCSTDGMSESRTIQLKEFLKNSYQVNNA